jgi:hypothetical protein
MGDAGIGEISPETISGDGGAFHTIRVGRTGLGDLGNRRADGADGAGVDQCHAFKGFNSHLGIGRIRRDTSDDLHPTRHNDVFRPSQDIPARIAKTSAKIKQKQSNLLLIFYLLGLISRKFPGQELICCLP